jgi:hypothetical protein
MNPRDIPLEGSSSGAFTIDDKIKCRLDCEDIHWACVREDIYMN